MERVLYRVPKISDGSKKCTLCRRVIRRGESYEEQASPNEKGKIEYWVNVCELDVQKQQSAVLAIAA